MKKSELQQIIKEEISKILKEGFQGDEPEGDGLSGFRGASQINKGDGMSGFRGNMNFDDDMKNIIKNREDRNKYFLEGVKAFVNGTMLDYGPYKDETFESDWWRKGWEQAELASFKRKNKEI